jgi:N-acetylmuramoyl-L-alanine amidase
VTVVMTRESDVFIDLYSRAAASARADLFVAIHADANSDPQKFGHSILLPQSGDARAAQAGQCIDRDMVASGSPSHVVRVDNRGLIVLKEARCPALLVELGFLSNPREARRLDSAAYREHLAEGIANGICEYLAEQHAAAAKPTLLNAAGQH